MTRRHNEAVKMARLKLTDGAVYIGILRWVAFALIGAAVAWVVGALPWLVEGMRLPISSGWPALAPSDEVRVALPFGEYHLVDMLVVTVVGGGAGVVAAHAASALGLASRRGWEGATGALLGLALAMALTLRTVQPLLSDGTEAKFLVGSLVGLGVVGSLLGAAAGFGMVRRSWWSPVGAALLAGSLGTWVVSLTGALLGDGGAGVVQIVNPWVVGTLVAAALVWTAWWSAGWLAWWPALLAIIWATPSMFAAMYYVGPYARSGMGTGPGRAELIDATWDVFVQALRPSNHLTTPYVGGLLVAVAVTVWLRRRAGVQR